MCRLASSALEQARRGRVVERPSHAGGREAAARDEVDHAVGARVGIEAQGTAQGIARHAGHAQAALGEGERSRQARERRHAPGELQVVALEAEAAGDPRGLGSRQRDVELQFEPGVAARLRAPEKVAQPASDGAGIGVANEVRQRSVDLAVDLDARAGVEVRDARARAGGGEPQHRQACGLHLHAVALEHKPPVDAAQLGPELADGRQCPWCGRRLRDVVQDHVVDPRADPELALRRIDPRKLRQGPAQDELAIARAPLTQCTAQPLDGRAPGHHRHVAVGLARPRAHHAAREVHRAGAPGGTPAAGGAELDVRVAQREQFDLQVQAATIRPARNRVDRLEGQARV